MSTPRLIAGFIRHGDYHQLADVPSALQPFDLNDQGKSQALHAASLIKAVLQKNNWQLFPVVDSSRLLRAWQTAKLITENLTSELDEPAEIQCFDDLAERSVGAVANLTIEQIEDIVKQDPRYESLPVDWKSNSHFCLPFQGAESLMSAGERVANHVTQQMNQLQNCVTEDTVKLFVGHGAAFRHAAFHLGLLNFEQIRQLSMYHAHPVFLEYIGDKQWRHLAGDWKVRGKSASFTD